MKSRNDHPTAARRGSWAKRSISLQRRATTAPVSVSTDVGLCLRAAWNWARTESSNAWSVIGSEVFSSLPSCCHVTGARVCARSTFRRTRPALLDKCEKALLLLRITYRSLEGAFSSERVARPPGHSGLDEATTPLLMSAHAAPNPIGVPVQLDSAPGETLPLSFDSEPGALGIDRRYRPDRVMIEPRQLQCRSRP